MRLSGIALMCAAKQLRASGTTFVLLGLVFHFEVVCLDRQDPMNNAIGSGGG